MELLKNKILKYSFVILAGLAVFFAGCGLGSDGETGTLEVRLHDAAADFDEVNVHIERVEVNKAEDDTGWVVINEPNMTYDLLELSNGVFAKLGEIELEVGTYEQIRLILSQGGHSVVIDSVEHDMVVPSGSQTGIKLNVNAEIRENIKYVLLLDFDALKSVVKTGQNNPNFSYLLQPVIRATNKAITGNIAGTVSPADAEPAVHAITAEQDTLTSVFADETTGIFELVGLPEGLYDVVIEPREGNYLKKTVNDVSVTVDETNDLGTIELSTQ